MLHFCLHGTTHFYFYIPFYLHPIDISSARETFLFFFPSLSHLVTPLHSSHRFVLSSLHASLSITSRVHVLLT